MRGVAECVARLELGLTGLAPVTKEGVVLRGVYLSLPIYLKLIRQTMSLDASFYRMSFSTRGGDVFIVVTNFSWNQTGKVTHLQQ